MHFTCQRHAVSYFLRVVDVHVAVVVAAAVVVVIIGVKKVLIFLSNFTLPVAATISDT